MKMSKVIGVILLAIWLILTGLIAALGLSLPGLGIVMGVLAVAAGAGLFVGTGSGITKDVGVILLAIWLIFTGLFSLLPLRFGGLEVVTAALALAAGAILLFSSGYIKARIGIILLSLWLILTALMTLVALSFNRSSLIMGIIAIAAGALLLIQR
jgi:hypothetical protein